MLVKPSRTEAAWSFTGAAGALRGAGVSAAPHPASTADRITAAAMLRTVTCGILTGTGGAVEEARAFLVNGLRPLCDHLGRGERLLGDLDEGAVALAHPSTPSRQNSSSPTASRKPSGTRLRVVTLFPTSAGVMVILSRAPKAGGTAEDPLPFQRSGGHGNTRA
nr:hypothetical protein GCM10020093_060330 [Planobispora longispora]